MLTLGIFAKIAAAIQLGSALAQNFAPDAYVRSRQRLDQKTHIKIDYQIHLSEQMMQAVKRYSPGFRVWQSDDYIPSIIQLYEFKSFPRKEYFAYQTPSAVIADFNGDGSADAVMMGNDGISSMIVALLSKAKGYTVLEIERKPFKSPKEQWYGISPGEDGREYGLVSYLTLLTPGRVPAEPDFARPELNLSADGFMLNVFEKSSSVYVYEGESFKSYLMGD